MPTTNNNNEENTNVVTGNNQRFFDQNGVELSSTQGWVNARVREMEEAIFRNPVLDRVSPIPPLLDMDDEMVDENDFLGIEDGEEVAEPIPVIRERVVTDRTMNPFAQYTESMRGFYGSGTLKSMEKIYDDATLVQLADGNDAKYIDCVSVDGRFYLKTDPEIVVDHFKNSRFLHKRNCSTINTTFDEKGKVKMKDISYYYGGYGSQINSLVELHDGKNHIMTDYHSIPKEFYTECFESNIFYHNNALPSSIVTTKRMKIKARKANNTYKTHPYNKDLKKDYEMGVVSPSFVKTEGKRYTFGVELETISGILPKYVDDKLNYLSIRDGSLKDENGEEYGFEYVTGVLVGDTGLLQLSKLTTELSKRCMVNHKCGVHVHLGGVKFSSELTVYLYKLFLMLEKQMFNMMPLSRRNNEYCKKLKPFDFNFTDEDFNNPNRYNSLIESYYLNIYKYVSATSELPSRKANKKTQHPLGAKCGYNHNTARYCWINFVPTIFDTRENGHNTIENRIMQGSTNFNKIKNWVLINMGILWFAENHKQTIALTKAIDLEYIMELAYPKTYMQINEFINKRTIKFASKDVESNKTTELEDYNEAVDLNLTTIKNL